MDSVTLYSSTCLCKVEFGALGSGFTLLDNSFSVGTYTSSSASTLDVTSSMTSDNKYVNVFTNPTFTTSSIYTTDLSAVRSTVVTYGLVS